MTKPDIGTALPWMPPSASWRAGRDLDPPPGRWAGLNHGLVHYYFGSVETLMLSSVRGFTNQLWNDATYAADVPFLAKWRSAMVP